MRLLLDSHALLWYLSADTQLSKPAEQAIGDRGNEVFVSVATLWELSIKHGLGKLTLAEPPAVFFPKQLEANGFSVIAIQPAHVFEAAALPNVPNNKDPFDRLLAAQAKLEGLTLVSADAGLDAFGIARIW